MIEEEKEARRQEKRAEAEEAVAKTAARQKLEARALTYCICLSTLIVGRHAELREEQLIALRRRQREKERVAVAQEAQRKVRREAEAEERAAQIKARRSAEAQARARAEAEAEVKAKAIEKARAEAEAKTGGHLQTERRLTGVSTNPPSATSPRSSTTTHPSPKTPAKSRPGLQVVSNGGWRTWEAERKAGSVVQSINVREDATAGGSHDIGVSQIQASSSPAPAPSVPIPATHGVDRNGVGWRQRYLEAKWLALERPSIPPAASKTPTRAQSSSYPLPAATAPISTKDVVTSLVPETKRWSPKRLQGTSGPPAHSQTTEVPTSIWRPKHVPGK
ncbi:hypothetical protein PAXRUDRAFT_152418 [Paxillus rubicundulus Ve08.2h10]|uniref:Uncharacterized protein n=1 Tax=Paxillus rubicundulus Ve08.2h10 TaxID=930991 RepID=A0A0D0DT47_9AGAM|nr:hypothetical protein PAXRUDRAFT_152418 [Paxillus rubicundulus Ve08.2h10]